MAITLGIIVADILTLMFFQFSCYNHRVNEQIQRDFDLTGDFANTTVNILLTDRVTYVF